MRIKYRKSFAATAVAILGLLMISPAQAAPTGTIHVVTVVLNDYAGTKTASDFMMEVKHFGSEVAGSPFMAAGAPGVTFVLEPGTYVVSQDPVDGYYGYWTSVGLENGFINLQAGDDVTIVRTIHDIGIFQAAAETPVTEDGGTLPATGSPWFNALGASLLLSAVGVIGLRRARVLSHPRA